VDLTRRWTTEALQLEANKYNTKSEFQKDSPNAYSAATRKKLISSDCEHMYPQKTMLFSFLSKAVGIYELWQDSELVYIGKSTTSMSTRLHIHYKEKAKMFNLVKAYEISSEADIHIIELYLINLYKPKYNILDVSKDIVTVIIPNIDDVITNVTVIDVNT